MIIVDNTVIQAVMDHYEKVENGILVNGYIVPFGEVIHVNAPAEVVPGKWCYTEKDGFFVSKAWLQSTDKAVQDAIDAYNLELIESGVM